MKFHSDPGPFDTWGPLESEPTRPRGLPEALVPIDVELELVTCETGATTAFAELDATFAMATQFGHVAPALMDAWMEFRSKFNP